MGLLKHLLGWPVTGPLFLTKFSLGKAHDAAIRELTDTSGIRDELMELQLRLESGEIDEEEYEEAEADLMRRLREAREWRRRLGLPVRGGPVRMRPDADGGGASIDVDLGGAE